MVKLNITDHFFMPLCDKVYKDVTIELIFHFMQLGLERSELYSCLISHSVVFRFYGKFFGFC